MLHKVSSLVSRSRVKWFAILSIAPRPMEDDTLEDDASSPYFIGKLKHLIAVGLLL